LRPGVAVPSRARAQNYPIQQNKQRIVRGYSWQLLSADWPLSNLVFHNIIHLRITTVVQKRAIQLPTKMI